MSFFDKIFGGNDNASGQKSFWKKIESEQELKEALEKSFIQKIAVFKHSTSCFISKTVLRNFEKDVENLDRTVDLYYLDLLAYRSLSNKIAEDLDVTHQSPQLIVIENGKAVNNASHQNISVDQII